jgi:hypothetical protein
MIEETMEWLSVARKGINIHCFWRREGEAWQGK